MLVLFLLLSTPAAAVSPQSQEHPMHHQPPTHSPTDVDVAGKVPDAAMLTTLKKKMGTTSVRLVKRGDAIPMDYIANRLTIVVDDDGRIVRIYKG